MMAMSAWPGSISGYFRSSVMPQSMPVLPLQSVGEGETDVTSFAIQRGTFRHNIVHSSLERSSAEDDWLWWTVFNLSTLTRGWAS